MTCLSLVPISYPPRETMCSSTGLLGMGTSRQDLASCLVAVEKIFGIASKGMELNSNKWKDLNVTSWSREECIKSAMQKDGSSCALWMLNFMEYWTGDVLSDIPNQTMSKLARDTVCREMLDIDQLAQLFRAWPKSDWYPYFRLRHYLFVF